MEVTVGVEVAVAVDVTVAVEVTVHVGVWVATNAVQLQGEPVAPLHIWPGGQLPSHCGAVPLQAAEPRPSSDRARASSLAAVPRCAHAAAK